nr:nuc-1 negative regulatory protein preg [Quercus suber]
MTTLTSSSPSPAASPRPAYNIQSHHSSRHQRAISSPRQSLRAQPYTVSNKSHSPSHSHSVNAPSALPLAAPRKDRRPAADEHGPETSSERFVDAGTQYSPDGSPPTSHRRPNLAVSTSLQPQGSTGSAKKRKELTRSESPPPPPLGQMSPSSSSASSSAGPTAQTTHASASHLQSVVPSASLRDDDGPRPGEPQEARSTHGHSSAPKRSKPEPGTVKIMPLKYETCAPKDLGILISNMLMELIRLNDQIPLRDGRLTRFHSRAPPGISVSDYLQRLIQHATLSPPIMLSMVYYIDRLCALYTPFTINSLTVHRFLIAAATVAAKGLSDSFWTNPTYARIGGIPVSELATLELEFLQKVDWKIVPKPETLEEYYRSLVDRTQGYELEVPSRSDSTSLDESTDSPRLEGDADEDDEMADKPA